MSRVPPWAWALVASLAWGGVQYHRAEHAGAQALAMQAAAAQADRDALNAQLEAQRAVVANHQQAEAQARSELAQAQGAARRADAARRQLLERVAAAGSPHQAASAAAAGGGEAACASSVVLADLLGRSIARVGDLAAAYDAARAAGLACERIYDGLTRVP